MKDVNILINNGVNVNASLELFGDISMYDETLKDFLEGISAKLTDIKKYKELSDMPNYAILVHSLKSDSKYLGFTRLAELAYQHELESKANNIEYVYNNFDILVAETLRIVKVGKDYFGTNIVPEIVINKPVIKKDKTILVVDDSDIIRNFVHKIFSDTYEVVIANDGGEAINIISNDNNDVVAMLLDLNMPKVDGFAVLDYLNDNDLFYKIPVTIITGDDSKDTVNRTFNYQISDIIQKPFNERDIRAAVEKMLKFN